MATVVDHNPRTKMEFSVKMDCASCTDVVKSRLLRNPGIFEVNVSFPEDLVLVETDLKSSEVQALLETTGFLVFFRGFGGSSHDGDQGEDHEKVPLVKSLLECPYYVLGHEEAAVAKLKGKGQLIGLLRMVQTSLSNCIIEVTMHGLPAGEYQVNIHELGDLSRGGQSCGEVYRHPGDEIPVGLLGQVQADESGSLQVVSGRVKVSDVIGRSVVVSSLKNERLMYGIIARSAGLFQNPKQICTCDGVSVWDEAKRIKDNR